MSFFDTTPQGRILNRFGKDVDVIDNALVQVIQGFLMCVLGALKVPIAVALGTPIFLVTLIPLGIFYFLIQVGFSSANTVMQKKLELSFPLRIKGPSGIYSALISLFSTLIFSSNRKLWNVNPKRHCPFVEIFLEQ